MPLYTYRCEQHGAFDKLKKMSEREFTECPECGKVCSQSLSAPAMVQGGYMDTKMSVTSSNARRKLI